ncbi:hypothetical protein IDH44_09180 [Paenibacillus sp. IB182496]|uniref:Uncharacterized protein n=1 Tax=Paenibacillus sabuli TaxID=2772509 RepID=A0A927BS96_9BACL|nr:hypothetical protein [Paenibacillus sabuli]MBD2845362.1 hypothetical protein [Paenibacillus sabuli]
MNHLQKEQLIAEFDWAEQFAAETLRLPAELEAIERGDRKADLDELEWLLAGVRSKLEAYGRAYPADTFSRQLGDAFRARLERLQASIQAGCRAPEACEWNRFLALKYELRTLYKQLGGVLAGSDWQTPCVKTKPPEPGVPEESGYAQSEQGTYTRAYGSEVVKAYERQVLQAYYDCPGEQDLPCAGYTVSSGMKALELALLGYRRFTGQQAPFYWQEGFYGEGVELTELLLDRPQCLASAELIARIEAGERIGGLLVDPGMSYPVRPPVPLERLMQALANHRQAEPMYVIVDRTLTSLANPLFARYAAELPEHIVLISVESGIKYLQYGFDMASIGYLTVTERGLRQSERREAWEALAGLLGAGAEPSVVRQLPQPDWARVAARLERLGRNAWWVDAYLTYARRSGRIEAYARTVDPSPLYRIGETPWIGAVFYIRLPGLERQEQVERWVDRTTASVPEEEHLVSGGSFGFDTFRMNAVSGANGGEAALRISVGREPLGQLLRLLHALHRRLP